MFALFVLMLSLGIIYLAFANADKRDETVKYLKDSIRAHVVGDADTLIKMLREVRGAWFPTERRLVQWNVRIDAEEQRLKDERDAIGATVDGLVTEMSTLSGSLVEIRRELGLPDVASEFRLQAKSIFDRTEVLRKTPINDTPSAIEAIQKEVADLRIRAKPYIDAVKHVQDINRKIKGVESSLPHVAEKIKLDTSIALQALQSQASAGQDVTKSVEDLRVARFSLSGHAMPLREATKHIVRTERCLDELAKAVADLGEWMSIMSENGQTIGWRLAERRAKLLNDQIELMRLVLDEIRSAPAEKPQRLSSSAEDFTIALDSAKA